MADDLINLAQRAQELRTAAALLRRQASGGSTDLSTEYPDLDLITADLLDGHAMRIELAPDAPLPVDADAALATARRISRLQGAA
jgi:2-methylisocitrate lyase-like PEP mutase family enzyme